MADHDQPPLAIGFGYDVHRFAPGRPLVLGGVRIEHPEGLDGHSDADVLLHALMDAILGAAGLGDIGVLFPNTDERWRGADSALLLAEVARRAAADGWRLANADLMIVAEAPKVMPHAPAMGERIRQALGPVGGGRVSIKATTNEGMGFIGRGEGIAAFATVLLARRGEE